VKPASYEEQLASMRRELDRRLLCRPIDHEYVQDQLDAIARLKEIELIKQVTAELWELGCKATVTEG